MNVYVRAVSEQLSALGLDIDVYTRRQDPSVPAVVPFAEGARVIHIDAPGRPCPFQRTPSSIICLSLWLACGIRRSAMACATT